MIKMLLQEIYCVVQYCFIIIGLLNASNINVAELMIKWWDYILFVILWNHYCSRELMFMDFVRYLYPKVYIPTKLLQIY